MNLNVVDGQMSILMDGNIELSDDSDIMSVTVQLHNPVHSDSESISVTISEGSNIALV